MSTGQPRREPLHSSYFVRGFAFIAVYAILDAAGLRSYTSIMSGTLPSTGSTFTETKILAALYLSFYLFAYLLAPIYIIAGTLQAILGAIARRRGGEMRMSEAREAVTHETRTHLNADSG